MAKSFRMKQPMSIDKSSWDWTVNSWHVSVIEKLIPRMVLKHGDEWKKVFENRIKALFYGGYPVFKGNCGCSFHQLLTGIMKSGCLGTIAFNSIWQVATHLAAGGDPDDVFYSLGDDTVQESVKNLEEYLASVRKTGCIVKEVDIGWPIKFGGHEFDEKTCVPSYRGKHMFNLLHLDPTPVISRSTLDSYQHLYSLDKEPLQFLHNLVLDFYGPEAILSEEYLDDWYRKLE